MNSFKIITIIGIYLTSFGLAFPQKNELKTPIWIITDSVIINNTDINFCNFLIKDSTIFVTTKDFLLKELDTTFSCTNYCKTYSITYRFPNFGNYRLHDINCGTGKGPAGLIFELDSNLKVSYINDIQAQYKIYRQYIVSKFISDQQAKNIANTHFSANLRTSIFCCLLSFDCDKNCFQWEITKYKGFMNVLIEKVYINAVNSNFINKETQNTKRYSIWQALFRNRMI